MKPDLTQRSRRPAARVPAIVAALAVLCSGNPGRASPPAANTRDGFSRELQPYPVQPTARTRTAEEILRRTTTPDATLSSPEQAIRRAVVTMYRELGIDLSLDIENFRSPLLLGLAPRRWSPLTPQPLAGTYPQPYSVDACFYHRIPRNPPRVLLPAGYIGNAQYNCVRGGDGIGFGIAVSSASDPIRRIRSQWYDNTATRVDHSAHVRPDALSFQGWNKKGDRQLIFLDASTNTVINAYHVDLDTDGVSFLALYASPPEPLGTLGDRGGSIAAGFSNLAFLIRPGEATDPARPIPHAVGGPVRRVWKARVYPASSYDTGIDGPDFLSGKGWANTGLVPYGGIIQLDPEATLSAAGSGYQIAFRGADRRVHSLSLSLPAFRVLQAMQAYGYYVCDYGGADLDIYTSTDEDEYMPYGGLYGNAHGKGVQNELTQVLARIRMYVVPAQVRRP